MKKRPQSEKTISSTQSHLQRGNQYQRRWPLRLMPVAFLLILGGGLLTLNIRQMLFQQNTHFTSEENQNLAKQLMQQELDQEAKVKRLERQLSAEIEKQGTVEQLQNRLKHEKDQLETLRKARILQHLKSQFHKEKFVIYDESKGIPISMAIENGKIKPEFHGPGGATIVNGRVYPLPLGETVLFLSSANSHTSRGIRPAYQGIKIEKVAEAENQVAQKHEPALPATDQLQISMQQDNDIELMEENTILNDFEEFWAEFLSQEAESKTQSFEDTRYPDLSIEPSSDLDEFMPQQSGVEKSAYMATENFFESLLSSDEVSDEDINKEIEILIEQSVESSLRFQKGTATQQTGLPDNVRGRQSLPPDVREQFGK